MILQITRPIPAPPIAWEKLPDDYVLPNDPVDNIHQPAIAAALTEALYLSDYIAENCLTSTNYGVCAKVNDKFVVKAPDWVYIPQIIVERVDVARSYTPQLQGEIPLIVMEFLSETDGGEYSIKPTYPPGKWYFYEQILVVSTYVIFDPLSGDLEVYRLGESGTYQLEIMNEEGRYLISEMQLSLGTWQGEREGRQGYWLRWWNQSGQMLLWGSEKAEQEKQRADQEKQRADLMARKLKELGIDPDTL